MLADGKQEARNAKHTENEEEEEWEKTLCRLMNIYCCAIFSLRSLNRHSTMKDVNVVLFHIGRSIWWCVWCSCWRMNEYWNNSCESHSNFQNLNVFVIFIIETGIHRIFYIRIFVCVTHNDQHFELFCWFSERHANWFIRFRRIG